MIARWQATLDYATFRCSGGLETSVLPLSFDRRRLPDFVRSMSASGLIRATSSALRPLPLFTQFQTYRCASLSAATGHDRKSPGFHSSTSSARTRKVSGIAIPMALAVLRLTTNSNLVGCSTGISAGFVPSSIFATRAAILRCIAT